MEPRGQVPDREPGLAVSERRRSSSSSPSSTTRRQELLAYGREKDIVSVDPKTNVTLQKLETLNRDYAAAVTERVAKEARYYEARNSSPDALANQASSGLVSQLQNDVAKLEREYAEKLNLFKPEWPAMQQLKIQIEKEKQHLATVIEETVAKTRETARSDYVTALRREESLRSVPAIAEVRGDEPQHERRRVQQPQDRGRDASGPCSTASSRSRPRRR